MVSLVKMVLVSGRSLEQGLGKETGKFSKRYVNATAVCQMDPEDMSRLNIVEGDNVRISSQHGSIIVQAVKSRYAPHPGIIFMAYGPCVNSLTSPNTHGTGMPSFKGLEVEVEPVKASGQSKEG
ncbi:MAG: molybdopterin dinucleotide binding domain-containing protein [Candidatus Bathyarchaeia archaeon]